MRLILSLWIERTAWVVGFTLLGTYGGMRLWAEESRTQAVEEFRADLGRRPTRALWSHQRVVAYAEAQRAGDAPEGAVAHSEADARSAGVRRYQRSQSRSRRGPHPGHRRVWTEAGNVGIAAHRDGFFRKLKDVELGMDIYPRARRPDAALPHHRDQHRDAGGRRGARAHRRAQRHAGHLLPVLLCRFRAASDSSCAPNSTKRRPSTKS